MKITIISVGKKHDQLFAPAIAEYEKRLKPFCEVTWQFIPSSDIAEESAKILKAVDGKKNVFLLDERGVSVTNSQLARAIEHAKNQSIKEAYLVIGGAYGVNRDVAMRADARIKLSDLVFPHQIVRLIVIEQIYRSFQILAGTGYHHE